MIYPNDYINLPALTSQFARSKHYKIFLSTVINEIWFSVFYCCSYMFGLSHFSVNSVLFVFRSTTYSRRQVSRKRVFKLIIDYITLSSGATLSCYKISICECIYHRSKLATHTHVLLYTALTLAACKNQCHEGWGLRVYYITRLKCCK